MKAAPASIEIAIENLGRNHHTIDMASVRRSYDSSRIGKHCRIEIGSAGLHGMHAASSRKEDSKSVLEFCMPAGV